MESDFGLNEKFHTKTKHFDLMHASYLYLLQA
jgi:hypothetical protein